MLASIYRYTVLRTREATVRDGVARLCLWTRQRLCVCTQGVAVEMAVRWR